ncbi:MAG: signal recognition particle protein [Clostridiales bacterium]|nr:signal recognition particle protein [Clostridiales bacterium]
MFTNLQEKLNEAFKKFKNKGKLSEKDVKEGLRSVKLALLEADVNFKVVKEFISRVTERAIGTEVLESLMPGQQVIKIVNEELVSLMGGEAAKIQIASNPPTVIMMVGLQGAGKTTHCAKLAGYLKNQGKHPLLVACDVYRPAAIKQLQVVGSQIDVPVYAEENNQKPVRIAEAGVKYAKQNMNDVVIIDTAGRLHIDEVLMEELRAIKETVQAHEILLVVDSMTGQDAVNVAEHFNELLDITGVLLTKLDGDTRGGAALSVKYVTGKPIKFIGTGEKLDALELFYPDRMASRILGMGDMLTLIEKAEAAYDEKKAKELEQKMRQNAFTLDDYLDQMKQVRGMGSMEQILSMMPGVNAGALKDVQIDEKILDRMEAMILSMTEQEKVHPEIIGASRKKRIAAGSGTKVEDVNKLLKQFEATQKMMKQFTSGKMNKLFGKKGKFKMPF